MKKMILPYLIMIMMLPAFFIVFVNIVGLMPVEYSHYREIDVVNLAWAVLTIGSGVYMLYTLIIAYIVFPLEEQRMVDRWIKQYQREFGSTECTRV